MSISTVDTGTKATIKFGIDRTVEHTIQVTFTFCHNATDRRRACARVRRSGLESRRRDGHENSRRGADASRPCALICSGSSTATPTQRERLRTPCHLTCWASEVSDATLAFISGMCPQLTAHIPVSVVALESMVDAELHGVGCSNFSKTCGSIFRQHLRMSFRFFNGR